MRLRRILALTCLLVALFGSPLVAATVDIAAGAALLILGPSLGFAIALWPSRSDPARCEQDERRIHRDMARNLSAGDPR